ncbi:MAG: hypothetical protein ACRDYX_16605, partial [Egibacteraceae bacterium]
RFSAQLQPGQALEVEAWAGDLDHPPPPAHTIVKAAQKRARAMIRGLLRRDRRTIREELHGLADRAGVL